MKEQIYTFLQRSRTSKYANVYLALLFAFSLFVQCVLFHWFTFHSIMVSSFWKAPAYFGAFYLPKISISLFISSLVFLFKRKYWVIYVSVLTNVWILAELVYSRSTRIFIDAYSFLLLKNLRGFESSIGIYLDCSLLLLLIPTLVVIVAVIFFDNRRRPIPLFGVGFSIYLIINLVSCNMVAKTAGLHIKFYYSHIFLPFNWNKNIELVRNTSIIHAFAQDMKDLICMPFDKQTELAEDDIDRIQPFICSNTENVQPSNPLIIILVESLETWAVRPDITSNLYRFLDTHKNILWAKRTKSQTKGGNSGDGQMILNLLPVAQGAACNRFPTNTYPSLSDVYSSSMPQSSAMIQPGDLGVWNQYHMNDAYHIDTAFVNSYYCDLQIFNMLDTIKDMYSYILAITISTHSPFTSANHYAPADLPQEMPTMMMDYLNSMHYTDSCWGKFLAEIDTDSTLKNSTICFMGDHIIFNEEERAKFQTYCSNKTDYSPEEAYTTFIAYSQNISQKTIIEEVTYQIDAFPTILSLIHCENYYWKGFGVNLLDSTARKQRIITEQEAYNLSDKVIRANYFHTLRHTY